MTIEEDNEPILNFPKLRAMQGGKTFDPPSLDWLSPMVKKQCFLTKKKDFTAKLLLFQIIDKTEKEERIAFCLRGEDGAYVWVEPKGFCRQFELYIDLGVTSD